MGDISSSYSGGTPKAGTRKYYNGKIPFIRSGEISNGFTELTITEDGLRNSAAKMVDKGDILYALYGATSGEVSIARINGAINQAIMAIKPFEGYDSYLLASLLQNNKTKITEKYLQGGQGNLSATIVKNLKLKVPSSKEQKLIGILLLRLDRSITLHEEKKQQLKCLKSALLQKMFANKNKSGDPDVRFKGFDERWERHILNDLAIFNPKGTLPTSFEYVDLGSVIGVEMISHKTISKFDAPSRAQRLAQVGDLFYQTVRPYQQNNYLFDNKDNAYVFSTGYAQLRPLIDGYFLLCLVQTKSFVRKVMNACTGTSYPAINSQDLAQIGVNIPINSKEQRLIGNLYKVIDNLITLYQQKLDDLNTIKQSLLQKMFI